MKQRYLSGAAILGVLFVTMPASLRAAERPLSLEEAITLALRNSETINIRRESVTAASETATGARGAYDPFLQGQAGWRRATEPVNSAFSGAPSGELAPTIENTNAGLSVNQYLPTGGNVSFRAAASRETTDGAFTLLSPAYGTQVGLEFRQPLLRGRSVDFPRLGIQVADADSLGAQASLAGSVNNTIAAVHASYWRLVAARREVEVREESIRLAEEQFNQTQTRIQGGLSPQTDLAQPRAEIERRRGEMLQSTEDVARAESLLKVLILSDADGDRWFDQLVPTEPMESDISEADVHAEMERAFNARPEVAEAAAVVERRKAESLFASNTMQATLDAVASYDWLGLSGMENPDGGGLPGVPAPIPPELEGGLGRSWGTLGEGHFNDARVGLLLGIPLGNRAARAAAAVAHSTELQAESDLARVRKAIRAEVLNAAAGLHTAAQRIETARSALEAAQVQLFAEQERFNVGLSTNFLVLTRQNDLSEARLEEISSLVDYRSARAEMGRATGSLLEGRPVGAPAAQQQDQP